MAPLVSILIPAFNSERWITSCLESALAQTWTPKEVIVVDDGSQDGTLEIARSFSSKIVQVRRQENRGASAARNHALSLAQGDYIQWLDADDLLAPDKITNQLQSAGGRCSSRVLLSGAWGQFYHSPARSRFIPNALWEDLNPTEWLFRKVDQNLWMAINSWLVSRTLTESAGPWNEDLSRDDDGEYFCRMLSQTSTIHFVGTARCFCRTGTASSVSHDRALSDSKLDSQWASILSHIATLMDLEDSPRTRAASLRLLERWAIYFYPERIDILAQLQETAARLGFQLGRPTVRGRYRWLGKLFGLTLAKQAQFTLPAVRVALDSQWDRLLCSLWRNRYPGSSS